MVITSSQIDFMAKKCNRSNILTYIYVSEIKTKNELKLKIPIPRWDETRLDKR